MITINDWIDSHPSTNEYLLKLFSDGYLCKSQIGLIIRNIISDENKD